MLINQAVPVWAVISAGPSERASAAGAKITLSHPCGREGTAVPVQGTGWLSNAERAQIALGRLCGGHCANRQYGSLCSKGFALQMGPPVKSRRRAETTDRHNFVRGRKGSTVGNKGWRW